MAWSPVPDLTSPGRPARVALAITALLAAGQILRGYDRLAETLNDTDDALRFYIVRALVGGRGWFDTRIGSLQPSEGIDMHWSRLVDGGLAALYQIFALVMAPEAAEAAMRLLWPLLWIFPLALGAVLTARRLGGSLAVLAAAIFIASYPVMTQFAAGRIDHHNVQMALAMLMLAGAVNLETRWGPWLAGIATGLLLAVGLEALLFAAICGAAVALRFVVDPAFAPAARRYGLSLAVSALLAYVVQTPPRLWAAVSCDMLSVNLLAGLVVAGAGLALASLVRGTTPARFAGAGAAALAALIVCLALDPACLRGPYAHMDPVLRPYWLDHVTEVHTLWTLWSFNPDIAAALITPVAMAAAALCVVLMRPEGRRDPAWILVAGMFAASVLSGLFVVRMLGYGAAFGTVILAAAFPILARRFVNAGFVATILAALAISPATVTAFVAMAVAGGSGEAEPKAGAAACRATTSFEALKALPPGLFLADIDAGPFILALTPHSALAAPYHRLNEGIKTAHELWSAPSSEAGDRLKRRGVGYVMLCPARGELPFKLPKDGLRGALMRGDVPDYLEPVPAGDVFKVWRVR